MSNITDLIELLAADDADLLEIVDTSDTSMAATGTNKRITVGNLREAIGGRKLIETITLGSGAPGEFNFASIPGAYNRLVIEGLVRGDIAAALESLTISLNGDTADASYYRQASAAYGGAASVGSGANRLIGIVSGNNAPADAYAQVHIVLEGYAGSTLKTARGTFTAPTSASDVFEGSIGLYHKTLTAAVTQIQLRTDNHATDQIYGTLRLYGEF